MSTVAVVDDRIVVVSNWYDDRRNVASLLYRLYTLTDISGYSAAKLVEKPWEFDAHWDVYQATLPESDRWRGSR